MKNLIFLLAFISMSLNSFSQEYPMFEGTEGWLYGSQVFTSYGSEHIYYRLANDTIIDSKVYHQIESKYSVHSETPYDYTDWSLIAPRFRQEGDSIYKMTFGGTEILIYDFSLEALDTFRGYEESLDVVFQVTKVDTFYDDLNQPRKRLYIEDINDEWHSDVWVEGIGSLNHMFYLHGFDSEYDTLYCYFNEVGPYSGNIVSCEGLPSSVEDQAELAQIDIYPNPTTDYVMIERENNFETELQLYNQIGKKVYSQVLVAESEMIDVSALSPGIYMALFYDQSRLQYSSKLILQR